jgi:parvulin-like peptidyl-prolyl isomerase
LALSVKDSITSADDFSNMARAYSADENTRDGGGNLGWINPASLPVKEMSQVLSILDVGEVSPPVNASDGYHLMLISDVRVGGFPTPESHWIEIEQMALAKKKGDFFNSWIEGVSSTVFIKSYLE